MRKTHSLVSVAMTLLDDPTGRHYGYELARRASVTSGALYPMLTKFLHQGWVEDGWEEQSDVASGRPPRRYYTLTAEGLRQLGGILEAARTDRRFATMSWFQRPSLGGV